VIFFDYLDNIDSKKSFVSMCDAMLHASENGDSFGLDISEFCSQNKPVFTFKNIIPEFGDCTAHHGILDLDGIYYSTKFELKQHLYNVHLNADIGWWDQLGQRLSSGPVIQSIGKKRA